MRSLVEVRDIWTILPCVPSILILEPTCISLSKTRLTPAIAFANHTVIKANPKITPMIPSVAATLMIRDKTPQMYKRPKQKMRNAMP